jgi:cyclophilin family peptidyl-prolyl cis-trans isomerase
MPVTLSHPIRPDPRLNHPRKLATWVSLAALCGCLLACNPVDSDTPNRSQPAAETEISLDPPFSWPEDPGHPVLEIIFETADRTGAIQIELMPELAPATVAQVIALANQGYYDGTTFHRVIPGFMIQGGDLNTRDRDPSNDGFGDPEISIQDEFGATPFNRGVVGMGNKGRKNSTSSQFFIMHDDNPSLKGRYNAIGRVIAGIDDVDDITRVAIDRTGRWGPKDRPIENVVMSRVRTIGQVAVFRAALELESSARESAKDSDRTPPSEIAESKIQPSLPPASLGTGDDWERLEIGGRERSRPVAP